jgi:hypothetical protein
MKDRRARDVLDAHRPKSGEFFCQKLEDRIALHAVQSIDLPGGAFDEPQQRLQYRISRSKSPPFTASP